MHAALHDAQRLRLSKGELYIGAILTVQAEGTQWSVHLVGTWLWGGVLPIYTFNGSVGRGSSSLGVGLARTRPILAICRGSGRCALTTPPLANNAKGIDKRPGAKVYL